MAELGQYAYLFSLTVRDLDASISDAPSGLYDAATIAAAAAAAGRLFQGPCFVVFERGTGDVYAPGAGRLHLHVLAHRDDGPQDIARDTERCKWVHDAAGLYRYLHKSDPYSFEALIDYTSARVLSPTGKPPRTRRHFSGAKRSAWLASHCTNDLTPNLPPVLPCRRRHLRHCPEHTAAAAAAVEATSEIPRLKKLEGRDGEQLESTSQIGRLDRLEGKDGRLRPRHVSRPAPTPPPRFFPWPRGPPADHRPPTTPERPLCRLPDGESRKL